MIRNSTIKPHIGICPLIDEKEEWKNVEWGGGLYQVSSFGRFKSLGRLITGYRGSYYRGDKLLRQHVDKGGYLRLRICNDSTHTKLSHRIVAIHFVDNPENKPWVNHIDGNKQNNHYKNLEWSTISENVKHAFDTGLHRGYKGEESPIVKINNKIALEIFEAGGTNQQIASAYNVSRGLVYAIKYGKLWSHITGKVYSK